MIGSPCHLRLPSTRTAAFFGSDILSLPFRFPVLCLPELFFSSIFAHAQFQKAFAPGNGSSLRCFRQRNFADPNTTFFTLF